MKSLVVCVEFDDFLAVTLPRNLRHFERTVVVTSVADFATHRLVRDCGCETVVTDVFYERHAHFNKGAAVEMAMDVLGRDGWICIWDADIVMPHSIEFDKNPAHLHTATRRTLADPTAFRDDLDWNTVPITGLDAEYPGYFQLFHAEAAGPKPWYTKDWTHAGGCDSDFQGRFSPDCMSRPPFNVLHLGPTVDEATKDRVGKNWCGRVTPRIDGGPMPEGVERSGEARDAIILGRRATSDTKGERLR